MVTIKDVARHAGVSVTTVSRVLNNSQHPISPATKQRVLAAIEELGFCPNAAARSLQLNETRTIGLILPDIANPYYPGIVRGVEDVAHESGYTVILCNTDRSRERTQEYLRVLREKRVDGVIFTGGGAVEDASQSHFFDQERIATVVIGRHRGKLPAVQVNNTLAAREAVEHLLSLGHRRIATITGPATSTTASDRLDGYRCALAGRGMKVDPLLIVEGNFEFESGYQAIDRLPLRGPGAITAIFAHNDLMAIGAMKALQERGLQVPGDIAVMGFDNIPLASFITPQLSTVAVPVYDLGVTAMKVLAELLAGREVPPVTTLATKLQVRDSTIIK
ncbi:LacI family DNA-binding transcriptional regulator [Neomoorella thermoacetica]|uniref:Catabolite control protein A n=3 Tax=Neomoorella thermoacetica TaxID=1525 RepID=A0A1D7XEE1_NEOTH|nr:LacI family DNA-binding transcriptional regulator [Moorella thermoacetica]AKX95125.1 catabolite control protein A [Moorella thermoacetica]AKX97750.1 catabolite control protein A [Moorella thermoacetica]AOQ25241.1 Catabolite control protein A [Moorella thermoacetica]OIQ10682.1 catabolite control protein A [Moorella thermoacetica]OIQ53256.1 catabolite control protein A [Moorella thermoacetica]